MPHSLRLLGDPERLADYVASFDREAYGDYIGEAVRKAQGVIHRIAKARGSIVALIAREALSETEAEAQLTDLETERAEAEAFIDRTKL